MTRRHLTYRCEECGAPAARWSGRCAGCGAWNSVVEAHDGPPIPAGPDAARPVLLGDVDGDQAQPRPTGLGELDRVLGGGLVPGSVTLLGGEPGIGKSTLLLQAALAQARAGLRCLVVCAEESTQQVKRRASRLGPSLDNLWLLGETSLAGVLGAVDTVKPDVLIVDSIQTIADGEADAPPGSVGQVRTCATSLVQLSKSQRLATVLVGHVTKDGTLAGPRVLEHLVDTVLCFEGERHHALRLLRATKHRFGPTGELGLFEMGDAGLQAVGDPSRLFLGDRRHGGTGSAVFPALEGHRPMLVEIQALVTGKDLAVPKRSASGYDSGRLALLVAVLEETAHVRLLDREVYVSVVGGVRVNEPGADLAVALAVASAACRGPVPPGIVACAELGLAGELRQVSNTARRLHEAARLGFSGALVAATADVAVECISAVAVSTLPDALKAIGIDVRRSRLRSQPASGKRGETHPGTARSPGRQVRSA